MVVSAINGKDGFVNLDTGDIPEVDNHYYMTTDNRQTLVKLDKQVEDIRAHTFLDDIHVDKNILTQVKWNSTHRENKVIHLDGGMKKKIKDHLKTAHTSGLRGLQGPQGPTGSPGSPDLDFLDGRYLNLSGEHGDQVFIDFDITAAPATEPEGRVWWNGTDHTLNLASGVGPVLQVGQEQWFLVYNDTIGTLLNGKIVYGSGGITDGLPHVEYAKADSHITLAGGLSVLTHDIAPGQSGIATLFGKVRGVNTTVSGAGRGYVSAVDAGEFVTTRPKFPNYSILMGGIIVDDAIDGVIVVNQSEQISDTITNFWNGTFRENFDFRVDVEGGDIIGKLTPSDGHDDMTMQFSDGFTIIPTLEDEAEITLTPAANDYEPVINYVYIPRSTKVLTIQTGGWPEGIEHIRVAQVMVQTEATTDTYGPLRNQNWNDHICNTDDFQGHVAEIGQRMRAMVAEWSSGAEASMTVGANSVLVQSTEGKVFQMHKQTFPVFNMGTGSDIDLINPDFAASGIRPYTPFTDLGDALDFDATGVSTNAKWFSVVVWGVCNKTGEESHLMCNLPTGSYNTEPTAVSDASGYAVYNIPNDFKGVGFLIARFTIKRVGDNFTYNDGVGYQDLRGFIPNSTAGSGAGSSGITTLLGLTDIDEATYTGFANQVLQVNAGETAMEFTDTLILAQSKHANGAAATPSVSLLGSGTYTTGLYASATSFGTSINGVGIYEYITAPGVHNFTGPISCDNIISGTILISNSIQSPQIGISTDTNLMILANDLLTVNGDIKLGGGADIDMCIDLSAVDVDTLYHPIFKTGARVMGAAGSIVDWNEGFIKDTNAGVNSNVRFNIIANAASEGIFNVGLPYNNPTERYRRFFMRGSGSMSWGIGSSTPDCVLQKHATANTMEWLNEVIAERFHGPLTGDVTGYITSVPHFSIRSTSNSTSLGTNFNPFDLDNYTTYVFITESSGTGITYDNNTGRFTVDSGYQGKYMVTFNGTLISDAIANTIITITVNGVIVGFQEIVVHTSVHPAPFCVSQIISVSPAQYVEFWLDSAANVSARAGTHMSLHRIQGP